MVSKKLVAACAAVTILGSLVTAVPASAANPKTVASYDFTDLKSRVSGNSDQWGICSFAAGQTPAGVSAATDNSQKAGSIGVTGFNSDGSRIDSASVSSAASTCLRVHSHAYAAAAFAAEMTRGNTFRITAVMCSTGDFRFRMSTAADTKNDYTLTEITSSDLKADTVTNVGSAAFNTVSFDTTLSEDASYVLIGLKNTSGKDVYIKSVKVEQLGTGTLEVDDIVSFTENPGLTASTNNKDVVNGIDITLGSRYTTDTRNVANVSGTKLKSLENGTPLYRINAIDDTTDNQWKGHITARVQVPAAGKYTISILGYSGSDDRCYNITSDNDVTISNNNLTSKLDKGVTGVVTLSFRAASAGIKTFNITGGSSGAPELMAMVVTSDEIALSDKIDLSNDVTVGGMLNGATISSNTITKGNESVSIYKGTLDNSLTTGTINITATSGNKTASGTLAVETVISLESGASVDFYVLVNRAANAIESITYSID